MGIADLALCKTALGGLSSLPEDLRGRVQASEDLGRKALERDGLKFLQDQGSYPHLDFNEFDPNPELHSDAYYGLYSLEKACILTGTERLGSVAWYATGARLLVREQSRDGGWGGHRETMLPEDKGLWVQESDPISTAFALLFLVRMADAYGTATPRPVDSAAGAGVATGKEDIPGGAIEPAAADALGDKDLRDLFDATFAALQGGAAPPEKAAGAFVREGPRVVPLLVRHLEDADIAARRSAIEALQRVTAGGPAFEPDATEETRAAQVAAWMSWWIVRKGRLARDPEHGKFVEKP